MEDQNGIKSIAPLQKFHKNVASTTLSLYGRISAAVVVPIIPSTGAYYSKQQTLIRSVALSQLRVLRGRGSTVTCVNEQ